MAELRTHADAIEFLRSKGIEASRRTWSMGDTVTIPFCSDMALLIPTTSSSWDLVHSVHMHEHRQTFTRLEDACDAALRLIALYELEDSCPNCGGRRRYAFGERLPPGRLRWFLSTNCQDCGARSEADGGASLPDDLRQIEYARNGIWEVNVGSVVDASRLKALRQVLDLSLAALGNLRRRLPGPVFHGTCGEALHLQRRLRDQGLDADVAARGAGLLSKGHSSRP